MKGRDNEAYRILFHKKYDMELSEKEVPKMIEAKQQEVNRSTIHTIISIVNRLHLTKVKFASLFRRTI